MPALASTAAPGVLQAIITGFFSHNDGKAVVSPMPRPSAHIQDVVCSGVAPKACAAWKTSATELVMLVGDPPYYSRFGFQVAAPGSLTLPGPVDPARILYIELVPGAFERAKGAVSPL